MIFNFDAKIQKIAKSQYEIHNWFKEYKGIFFAILVLKFFTSAVSIVAGYKFMYNTFYQLCQSENWSIFFSVTALLIIEMLSMYFISKATKNFWHRRFVDCAKLGLGALLVFALSSYISIKGMVFFTSERVDNTELIVNESKILLDNLTTEHNDIVTQYKKSIQEIKNNPEGWVNGKRSVLTSAQQENIQRLNNYIKEENDRFYKERAELKADKQASLTKNETETEEKSNNYGRYVAIIMAMQLLTGVGVSYCYMKISLDGNEEFEFKEVAKDVQDYATNTIRQGLIQCMERVGASVASAIGINSDNLRVLDKNRNKVFAITSEMSTEPSAESEQGEVATVQESGADPKESEPQKAAEPTSTEPPERKVAPIPKPKQTIGFDCSRTYGKPLDTGECSEPIVGNLDGKDNEQLTNLLGVAVCPYCGKKFQKRSWNQKFCTPSHKVSYWEKNHGKKLPECFKDKK